MPLELLVRSSTGAEKVVRLDAERYSFGRAAANDFAFPEDGELSRQHLSIERFGDGWLVVDQGSRNGTQVNGKPISGRKLLRPGDSVTAGRLTIEFRDPTVSQDRNVVFVDKPGDDAGSSIVSVSLDGLLGKTRVMSAAEAAPLASATQMAALIQAGRELVDRRPLDELFPLILDLAANAVRASRGVLMLDEGGGVLKTKAVKGDRFEISRTVRDRVLKEKESLLIQDVRLDEKLRAQASIVIQNVRSILAVPLQTREKVIGLIYLDAPHMVHPFTREDLSLLTVMANIAAIRLENARLTEVEEHEKLMARDLEQAADIQKNLLPGAVPVQPELEIAAFSAACRSVGSDYFDFYRRKDKLILLVGDVAGKGMPAALLMASLQAKMQVLAEEEIDLAVLVTRLNASIAANCPGNRFITFFVCEIDLASGAMTYVNAGHNPPAARAGPGAGWNGWRAAGSSWGSSSELLTSCRRRRWSGGDLLVLFTDGVTEAERPGSEDDFGEQRLLDAIGPVDGCPTAEMIEKVKAAVTAFAGSVTAQDDFTLVLARRN